MNYAVSNTKEIALEQAIERRLCGVSSEELAAGAAPATGRFRIGQPSDFDAPLALDRAKFWEFLETTQSRTSTSSRRTAPPTGRPRSPASSTS